MSGLQDQLLKLDSLKNTSLGNLNLPNANADSDGLIRLSGVTRNSDGELIYVDDDGSETKIATVEATTGFSRFVFDIDGQFSLVADSYKDTINMLATSGLKITTDPSTDTMIFEADPLTLLPVVGTGNSVMNSAGNLRTLVAGNNLTITTTQDELTFDVDLSWEQVGVGLNLYSGLNATGQPQIRSFADSDTVKFSLEPDGLTLSLQAIPNLVNWGQTGVGVEMMLVDSDGVGKIRNISHGSNIRLNTEIDGELTIQSLQAFSNSGAGIALVSQGANDVLEYKTLSGGGNTTIVDDGSGMLTVSSTTELDNVGTGAPISYTDLGRGKIRSIKGGLGVEVQQNATEIELQANVGAVTLGTGASLGSVTAGGLLELKSFQAADATVVITENAGTLEIRANHDDYLVNGYLADALDGSGDKYHLILETHVGLTLDAGPLPYLRAEYDSTLEEITVYNRNTLVGKIPDDNPAVSGLDALEGDYEAGSELYWDYTMDFAAPNNEVLFLDLEN